MAGNDFSTLFDLLPIGAYRAEPGGRQLRANQALVRIYGFASEAEALDIFNRTDLRWYVEDRRREQFREILATHGEVRNFVSEVLRDHGRQRIWVAENAHMVRDAAGNALYYEGTVEDITERRTNELALQANEKSFRELSDALQMTLHSVAQGIVKINADGRIVFFSQRALELLDLPESLLAAQPTLAEVTRFQQERGDFGELLERIETDDGRNVVVRLLDGSKTVASGTYFRRTAAGRVLEVKSQPLADGGMVRTYAEVTDYFDARDEIARQRAQLSALINTIPDMVWLQDAEGAYRLSNPAHQRQHGLPADRIIGKTPEELFGRDLADLYRKTDLRALQSPVPTVYEMQLADRSGGPTRLFEIVKAVMRDDSGMCTGILGIARDITARKETESALIAARDVAEAATRAKAEFLANMSHEIRTPMNAVIGMSDLLLDTPLTTLQREFAETIRTSGDGLLVLINDILDFSKIESGFLQLERVPVTLAECIESAFDLTSRAAGAKGLDLLYWIEDEVPRAIYGDLTRLRQVFINLVNNAVKFTQQGEVFVRLALRTADDGTPLLHASVRDSGIGIPAESMGRLFQVFSQVDASTTRQYGGTGLGLAICRRLVDLMGGRIWVESEPDKGSNFQFEIPFEAAPAVPQPAARKTGGLAGRRLLLVDDNATNRRIMTLQTQRWGMLPQAAASGAEALAWIDAGQPFDLAVIDVQMPAMDGYMLAAELRKRRTASQLPILALTSLGDTGGRFEGLGVAQILMKPTKASVLFDALSELFERAFPAAAAPTEPRAPKGPKLAELLPLRLLVAEDNAVNQRVAILILNGLGYSAEVAANGLLALEAAERAAAQGRPFDAILMDVQMPEMDGLVATRQLCERWTLAQRPWIIAMTANAMEGDQDTCLAAGMDDYLSKPIRAPLLADALRRAATGLGLRRG